MKQSKTWLLLVLVIALLLGGGTVAYRLLGNMISPAVPFDVSSQSENGALADQTPAPDFTVYDAEDSAVTLSAKRGKPVLVNFWATWCAPCREELPDLQAAFDQYGDQIEFLFVNLTDGARDTVDGVQAFMAENDYHFPVYFDKDDSGATAFGVSSIPTTVLIGADGTLVHTQIGGMRAETIRQLLDGLLAQ